MIHIIFWKSLFIWYHSAKNRHLFVLFYFCTYHAIRHLYLNNNNLEGTIPPTIDNLHLAEQIYLGQNKFNGTLPSNIGTNRPNKWRFFSVYDNDLTGPIPEGMRLNEAFMLDLSRNEFYGTIPNDISHQNYTKLRLLYLDHNKLTGTIPGALMQIQKLKGLFLNDNRKLKGLNAFKKLLFGVSLTTMPLCAFIRPRGHDSLRYC